MFKWSIKGFLEEEIYLNPQLGRVLLTRLALTCLSENRKSPTDPSDDCLKKKKEKRKKYVSGDRVAQVQQVRPDRCFGVAFIK